MIYPENFEEKTGFDKIRIHLKENCLSELGKQRVDDLRFYTDYEFIKNSLLLVNEFKHICIYRDDFPVSYYIDVRKYLNKIRIENTYLTQFELFDLKRSLETIKNIISFFKKTKDDEYLNLKEFIKDIQLYPFVYEKINSIISKTGEIKDGASPELKNIRINLRNKQNSLSGVVNRILRSAQKENWVEKDASVTIRDGKMLIPVSASYKRRIKGAVYDESATGKTAYIEPFESIELNNEIREYEFAEKREIIRILMQFSDDIRPYIDELVQAYELLADIDLIRAKALFALKINAIMPRFQNDSVVDVRVAIHPLLYLAFEKEKRKVVPLDLELNESQRIILISGPNAGGKSVCLKTTGLLQYMLQCGLLIPVSDSSVYGIFKQIFIDIGDEQSIENDLSTYSSHLYNMKHFIENVNSETLILIDEFGTGTEPLLGAALAESILETLNKKRGKGVITTHYSNLKHFATESEGLENGAMLFDSKNMKPLYQLEIGKPGSSFAFEIAGKIGLPQQILKNAADKIGQEHIDFEKHLQDIEQDKRKLKSELQKLEQKEKKLENELLKLENEQEFTLKQRKNIINIAKEQAKVILNTANKQIENTIFEIKKAEAEKEKTKKIRENLNEFKNDFKKELDEEEAKIKAKIEKIKQKEHKKSERKKKKKLGEKQIADQKIKNEDQTIKIGDKVKVKDKDTICDVVDIKDNTAMVLIGNMQMFVSLKKLEKISKNKAKEEQREKEQVKVNVNWESKKQKGDFLFGLDVRGLRAEEALQKVMKYIDEAIVAESKEVKILHGTGNGILRQVIRDYLSTQAIVKRVRDEKIQLGGAGISIVELDY